MLVTKDDWKFMKKIRRSDVEPLLLRFLAFELSGWYCAVADSLGPKKDDAMIYFNQASKLLDSATEDELRILDWVGGHSGTVGDFMISRRKAWIIFTCEVAEKSISPQPRWGPKIAGSHCDGCGKSLLQLRRVTFEVCSRCQLAYYCSSECHSKALREGHKKICRKKGEFKRGDFAYSLESAGEIVDGDRVQIVAPVKPEDGSSGGNRKQWHWTVQNVEENQKTGIVSARRLKRIRPSKWDMQKVTQADWERNMVTDSDLSRFQRLTDEANLSGVSSEGDFTADIIPILVAHNEIADGDEE